MAEAELCQYGVCHTFFATLADPQNYDTSRWRVVQNDGKGFIYQDVMLESPLYLRLGDWFMEVFSGPLGERRCHFAPFQVVETVGNPWQVQVVPCSAPASSSCFPTIRIAFDPSLYCNTTPCDKVRLIQAYTMIGACPSGCPRSLSDVEQGVEDGPARDATAVAGWTIDAFGDIPNTATDEAEDDPYMNGNDAVDFWTTGHRVGRQGDLPLMALAKDRPRASVPALPADITHFSGTFEVNAFCSDGPIQGEWLGRVVWQWEKDYDGPASIVLVSQDRSKPSQEFMDALRMWCQVRGFDFPGDDVIPKSGGLSCTP